MLPQPVGVALEVRGREPGPVGVADLDEVEVAERAVPANLTDGPAFLKMNGLQKME